MSDQSAIQSTDATLNVVTGCTKISPGCAHCYIERTPPFRMQGRKFERGRIPLMFHPERLAQLRTWKQPRRVFVNSLSDLFHEDVPDQFLHDTYRALEQAGQHRFQILTKRPDRMRAYLDWRYGEGRIPARHLWHGVSVENQRVAWRIDVLRETRSAVRFLSLEPLLEDIALNLGGIHWVIVGGESGAGARPFDLDWGRSILRQCKAAGVPVFYKQGGSANRCRHDAAGGCLNCMPSDLRIRTFPA